MKEKIRVALIGLIWLLTALDIWACQAIMIPEHELNPIARLILEKFDIWTLVAAKVFGTWICTEWLRHLHFYVTVSVVCVILFLIALGVVL